MDLAYVLNLIWGGMLIGGIGMAITRTAFAVFGGKSTTDRKDFPYNVLPWAAEYIAYAFCSGYLLVLFDIV